MILFRSLRTKSCGVAFVLLAGALPQTLQPTALLSPLAALAAPTSAPVPLTFAREAFERIWIRNDQPVADQSVPRSWTWGPTQLVSGLEPYAEAPDGSGKRLVQYFDKSRMEINDPQAAPDSNWYVTNGLLTVELISGQMQVGNNTFETRAPANIPMASDADDVTAPTYASFATVTNIAGSDKRMADNSKGGFASSRIDKEGLVTNDPSKAGQAMTKIAYFEPLTGHNVPAVFWNFLHTSGNVRMGVTTSGKALFDPWVFTMGLPISDAYWANVKIAGRQQEVLIQAFERRVLTYAPELPPAWQVQMGNIGQHYYQWRYGSSGMRPEIPQKVTMGTPAYLSIPALGVLAKVEQVGLDKEGNMDVPKDPFNVAWYKASSVPGTLGNAVIDGHLDWYGINQAVFYYLSSIRPGDHLYVRDQAGHEQAFVVTRQLVCNFKDCPSNDVFGPTTGSHLNLITCAGTFNRATQNYDKRVDVFSQAIP